MNMMNKRGMLGNLIGGMIAIGIMFVLWGTITDGINTMQESCKIDNSSENCELLNDEFIMVLIDNKILIFAGIAFPFLFIFGRGFFRLLGGIWEGVEDFITDLAIKTEKDNEEKRHEYLKESNPQLKVRRSKPYDQELHKAARKYYESKIRREAESEPEHESKPGKESVKDSGVDWGKGMDSYEEMKGDDKNEED